MFIDIRLTIKMNVNLINDSLGILTYAYLEDNKGNANVF